MSKQRQKGTAFESSLLPLLREYYPGAERRALAGVKDKGDFILPGASFALEAKNCKQMQLSAWVREAEVEAENLGVPHGVVVHKRRGVTDPARQYVTLTLKDFLELVTRP
jgi:hypothetical protein